MVFYAIVISVVLFDLGFWWWADRRLRPLDRQMLWRGMLAVFMAAQLATYVWIMGSRWLNWERDLPIIVLSMAYLWHLLVAPFVIVVMTIYGIWLLGRMIGSWLRTRREGEEQEATPQQQTGPTRRELLLAAAVAAPPLLTGGLATVSLSRLHEFRIRDMDVPVAGLPRRLEGLVIAHVSDSHVGHFSSPAQLRQMVEQTNALKPDLILFTGDLIDFSHEYLDQGIQMLSAMRSRYGLFVCEGNHDLFQGRRSFELGLKNAGLNLLLNESAIIDVRGEPVQILGLRWGASASHGGAMIEQNLRQVAALRKSWAFPILLAHHPHALDGAAEAGLPLVLSGHTHGGQLMLGENLGAGPALFRYWSGLYRRGKSSLVVSNGIGNWFPLRTHAPAELLRLRLTPAGHI